jgi:DNA polymerase III subunit epsilon
MNFLAIDFETANEKRSSPCALGIAVVKNFEVVEKRTWLIRPPELRFNGINTSIHGITAKDVAKEPTFDQLWKKINHLFQTPLLVAHNAPFDLSVLRATLDHYKLPYPELHFGCSVIYAKQVWPHMPDHKLPTLSRHLNIQLHHHEAGSDALACAHISLQAFRHAGIQKHEHIKTKLRVQSGQLYPGGYHTCRPIAAIKPVTINAPASAPPVQKPVVAAPSPAHPFHSSKMVFTGNMKIKRANAMQLAQAIGAIVSNTVSTATDYLVVGDQDVRIVGMDGMSAKQEKAVALIKKGAKIKVIGESEFLKMVRR